MPKLTVVTGSVRPNSVNSGVVKDITTRLSKYDAIDVEVADLGELQLPFFDASMPPSAPEYEIPYDAVQAWSDIVKSSDAIVLLMPEYNAAMTAVQKTLWIGYTLSGKIVAIVTYGFHEGRRAVATLESINSNIHTKLLEPVAQLQFMRELSPDGSVIDQAGYDAIVQPTIDAVVQAIDIKTTAHFVITWLGSAIPFDKVHNFIGSVIG